METENESSKLLARKISRLKITEYNKVKEGVCSGSIQPSKIGQIMSSSQCGKNDVEKAELETISNNLSTTKLTKFYFFITVKNLNNGEECMHKIPLESLKDWQHKFLEEPIFKNINLVEKPHFPELLEPTPGSLMWTHTTFSKGGDQFVVIATLTYPPSIPSSIYLPTLDSDYIVINAVSPLLPSTHATYSQLPTSQLRRSCALQYAFMALAEQYGFEIKGLKDPSASSQNEILPYAMISSVLHGNQVIQGSDWCKYHISGVISSPGIERNAGTNTIPATLQSLHFLLFGLDSQDSVSYDVIQPHKYGYIFQIKNVAGWCLNAGVNMYGTYNVIDSIFQDRGLSSSSANNRIGNGEILSALSYDVIKNTLKLVYIAKEKAEQDYKESLKLWSDAPIGMKSSLSNIETVTLESERNKIPSYIWQHMLRYIGLNLISDKLAGDIYLLDQKIEIQRGNALLNTLIKGYGSSAVSVSVDIINISNTISVIFDVCKGIASEMVKLHKTPKKLLSKLKKSSRNDIPLDPAKVILFLTQCIGLPPNTWFKNASPYLFDDPTEFTRFILTGVNQYSIFYPANAWGDSAIFKSYILKSSSFNHSIANAKKLAKELEKSGLFSKTWTDDSRSFSLTKALAYVILTSDEENLMANWAD